MATVHRASWERVMPPGSTRQDPSPHLVLELASDWGAGGCNSNLPKVPAPWLVGVHHSPGAMYPTAICHPEGPCEGSGAWGSLETGLSSPRRGSCARGLTTAPPPPQPALCRLLLTPTFRRWKVSDELLPPGASEAVPVEPGLPAWKEVTAGPPCPGRGRLDTQACAASSLW